MSQVHSSRHALDRARAGITAFSMAMIASDAENRRHMAHAGSEADAALERREQDVRSAEQLLRAARSELRSAEAERAAAETELSAALAAVPSDERYAAAARARVDRARDRLSEARSREQGARHELDAARARLRRAEEARDRCAAARRRIHEAAAGYRSAALTYVAASTATVSAGRRTLGRLASILEKYLAIEAYSSAAAAAPAASGRAGTGGAGRRSSGKGPSPAWTERFGLSLVRLAEIEEVSYEHCAALHRWDVERFENVVESLLAGENWQEEVRASDVRDGRSGERTLRGVVDRLCLDPVVLRDGSPVAVVSGHGHVAAARRAGMDRIPARLLEEDAR